MANSILLVSEDDETRITLQELLQPHYDVFCAEYVEDGLDLLDQQEVCEQLKIVLVDEDLDLCEAVEVLAKAFKKIPLSQRILSTELTDARGLIEAINRGRIFKLLQKPYPDEALLVTLEEASREYEAAFQHERQLHSLHDRHLKLKHLILEKHDELSHVHQDLQFPSLRDCEGFVSVAGKTLPEMLQESEELLRCLDMDDPMQIMNLAHQLHIRALTLSSSFESFIRNRREKS